MAKDESEIAHIRKDLTNVTKKIDERFDAFKDEIRGMLYSVLQYTQNKAQDYHVFSTVNDIPNHLHIGS